MQMIGQKSREIVAEFFWNHSSSASKSIEPNAVLSRLYGRRYKLILFLIFILKRAPGVEFVRFFCSSENGCVIWWLYLAFTLGKRENFERTNTVEIMAQRPSLSRSHVWKMQMGVCSVLMFMTMSECECKSISARTIFILQRCNDGWCDAENGEMVSNIHNVMIYMLDMLIQCIDSLITSRALVSIRSSLSKGILCGTGFQRIVFKQSNQQEEGPFIRYWGNSILPNLSWCAYFCANILS
jgi:hypothetical protein